MTPFIRPFGAAAALAIAASALGAQSVLRGSVIGRSDGAPVVAAEVAAISGTARARSRVRGEFTLAVRPGDSLRVRALGFREARIAAVDGMRVVLEPIATTLPALVTTAGQRTIRAAETPASVVVLSRNDIDAAAATRAADLLRQLPGVQELPTPPSRSGLSIRGLDGPRVLVLVDGEPTAGASSDTRDVGRLSTLGAERIEITRGPSGVEFGSDALGGVINLVTAAPSPRPTVDATVRAGGLGRRESSVEVSNTVGEVGVRASGGWRQTDRLIGTDATGSTLDRAYDARADVRFREASPFSLRIVGQASRERQRWPVGGGYNGFIDDHTADGFVEAAGDALGGRLRARAFGQLYAYEFRQAQGDLPIAGSADSVEQTEHLGKLLVAWTRALGTHAVDAGAQLSTRSVRAPGKITGDTAADRVAEVFARDGWTAGHWLIAGGARYTNSSLWGDALTPSAGLTWSANDAWRLRANVARGFRAPSFKEIRYTFINAGAGYTISGNPDLEPEHSWSTSAGFTWAPAPAFALDAELYRNDVSKLIDTRLSGTNPAGLQVYRNVNVARARLEGAEASVHTTLGGVEASVSYDYLHARDLETGSALDQRAAHTARGSITRRWSVMSGLVGDLSARYSGSAPMGTQTQAAFTSLNGQARLGLTPSLELSVGGNNLFGARPSLWTPAYDRQFYAGVRVRAGR